MNLTPIIYCILTVIAFGLGVTITYDQIKAIRNFKVAFLIGVTSQFGFMPFIGWALSRIFGVNKGIALGTVILCSSPGGAFSNFFCYHSGGNLTLSVAMTAFSTIVAMGMMPLMIWIWADKVGGFGEKGELENLDINYGGLLLTLMFVLVPTILGIWTRRTEWANEMRTFSSCTKEKKVWEWFLRTSTICAIFFILLAFTIGLVRYHGQIFRDWRVVLLSLLILPCGATFGYLAAKLAGLSYKEAITVSFETGVQNRTIPLAIIEVAFDDGGDPDRADVLQAVLHYICMFYFEVFIMWVILRKLSDPPRMTAKEALEKDNENGMVNNSFIDANC